MAEDNDAMAEAQIESTLVFDVEHYPDRDPYDRVAEGIHESGNRKVVYLYDLDTETDETMLRVQTEYYLDGELKNESPHSYGGGESYRVEDGVVQHTGEEVRTFIRSNFEADPEVTLTDEFESMVDEAFTPRNDDNDERDAIRKLARERGLYGLVFYGNEPWLAVVGRDKSPPTNLALPGEQIAVIEWASDEVGYVSEGWAVSITTASDRQTNPEWEVPGEPDATFDTRAAAVDYAREQL